MASSALSADEHAAIGEILRDLPAEVLDAARNSADSQSRVASLLARSHATLDRSHAALDEANNR